MAERLKEIQIECWPALDVIKRYKRKDVLIYADPPYLSETRNGSIYKYERIDDEHADLIATPIDHPEPVVISGYTSQLYNETLSGWVRGESSQVIETGQKRTEVLWINPIAARTGFYQESLF
ncbi:DNA adenine methylase [Sporolactobacillus laevolacticus]|uniref:DNA adenine methylase n=1 Tax=Sporolactobacillus laevolacticus TaxID=33018 RepID=UPI00338F8AA5